MNLIEELLKQFAEKSGQNKPLLPGQPAGGTPPFVPPVRRPVPAPDTSWAGDFAGQKIPPKPPLEEVTTQGRQHLHEVQPNVTGKHLQDIETPDRGDPKQKWFKTPFHKDNDRMAMMFSALSDGFGGMTMSGKSGMAAINKANYAKGMEGVQNNKTMKYLIDNKPELARKLMEIAPEHRGQFMEQAIKSQFEGDGKQSVFAEKVSMIMSANPGMTQADAIKQAQSPSSVTNINTGDMGGGAKPFQEALGKQAAEWMGGRRISSGQNRAEANRVIGRLQTAIKEGDPITGDFVSYLPESARNLFGAEGVELQQDVERIVQQSLKETLGAQFAQKEAEQLFARTWNPKASPEVNLRRTQRLLGELDAYASNMDAITSGMIKSNGNILQHLNDNPELAGVYTADTIYNLEYDDPFDSGTPVNRPSDVDQATWNLMPEEDRELFR